MNNEQTEKELRSAEKELNSLPESLSDKDFWKSVDDIYKKYDLPAGHRIDGTQFKLEKIYKAYHGDDIVEWKVIGYQRLKGWANGVKLKGMSKKNLNNEVVFEDYEFDALWDKTDE